MSKLLLSLFCISFFISCNTNKKVQKEELAQQDSLAVLHKLLQRRYMFPFLASEDKLFKAQSLKTDVNNDGFIDYVLVCTSDENKIGIFFATSLGERIDINDSFLTAHSTSDVDGSLSPLRFRVDSLQTTNSGFSLMIYRDQGVENLLQVEDNQLFVRKLYFEYNINTCQVELIEDNLNTFKNNNIAPILLSELNSHWYYRTLRVSQDVFTGRTLKIVKNEEELETAIGSNTTIILDAERFDITINSMNRLYSLSNLAFISSQSFFYDNKTYLKTANVASNIMTIDNCKNILLSGVDLYRDETPDPLGITLSLLNSENVEIVDSELSGYSKVGLNCEYSKHIKMINTEIYHNPWGYGCNILNSSDLIFNECPIFWNMRHIVIDESKNIAFTDCDFSKLSFSGGERLLSIDNSINVSFESCKLSDNSYLYEIGQVQHSENIGFKNCIFEDNSFFNGKITSFFKIKFSPFETDEQVILFEGCDISNNFIINAEDGAEDVVVEDPENYEKKMRIWVERFDKEVNTYEKSHVYLDDEGPTLIYKYRKSTKTPNLSH